MERQLFSKGDFPPRSLKHLEKCAIGTELLNMKTYQISARAKGKGSANTKLKSVSLQLEWKRLTAVSLKHGSWMFAIKMPISPNSLLTAWCGKIFYTLHSRAHLLI